jgi:hypothetical protein
LNNYARRRLKRPNEQVEEKKETERRTQPSRQRNKRENKTTTNHTEKIRNLPASPFMPAEKERYGSERALPTR